MSFSVGVLYCLQYFLMGKTMMLHLLFVKKNKIKGDFRFLSLCYQFPQYSCILPLCFYSSQHFYLWSLVILWPRYVTIACPLVI